MNYDNETIDILDDNYDKQTANYEADKIIGVGNSSVYLYYYNTYKKYAEKCGEKIWECKIGRTDKDPLHRILGQSGTCFPEIPHIALIIKCQNSLYLEQAIHSILKIRGKWIEDAPGTEWYLTSPNEVESIYNLIIK